MQPTDAPTQPDRAPSGAGSGDDLACVRANPLVQEVHDNRTDLDNPHVKVILIAGAKFKSWYSDDPDVARFRSATDAMIATMQIDEPGANPPRYTLGVDGEHASVFDLDGFPMLAEQIVARLNDTAPAHRFAPTPDDCAALALATRRHTHDGADLHDGEREALLRLEETLRRGSGAGAGAGGPADVVAGGLVRDYLAAMSKWEALYKVWDRRTRSFEVGAAHDAMTQARAALDASLADHGAGRAEMPSDDELLNDFAAALTADHPARNELRDARAAVISRMKGAGK